MMKKIFAIFLFCTFLMTAPAFGENAKMGFIDMRKVFFDYNKTKNFNSSLEKEDEEAKKELEKRSDKLRKLKDEIDLLSDEARKKREPELRNALQSLVEYW